MSAICVRKFTDYLLVRELMADQLTNYIEMSISSFKVKFSKHYFKKINFVAFFWVEI